MNPEAHLGEIPAKIAEGHPINKIGALLPWQAKSSSGSMGTPNAYIDRAAEFATKRRTQVLFRWIAFPYGLC